MVYADHKPLTNALKSEADKYSPLETRIRLAVDTVSQCFAAELVFGMKL